MSLSSEQLDAIRRYLLEKHKPQTRLDYYALTNAERAVLRAMCAASTGGEGQDVGASAKWHGGGLRSGSREWMALRAGLCRRQVDRILDGYQRSPNSARVPGLIERGLVSVVSPPNKRSLKPAILRINWLVFDPDPRQEGHFLYCLDRSLPGVLKPNPEETAEPIDDDIPPGDSPVQIPVETLKTYRHGVHRPLDTVSIASGHGVHRPLDTVSREVFRSIRSTSEYSEQIHSPSAQSCVGNPPARSAWENLHPGLYRKLKSSIDEVIGERPPNMSGWDPEKRARYERDLVLEGARRCNPPIWTHTAEKLAEEMYESVLKQELEKSGSA